MTFLRQSGDNGKIFAFPSKQNKYWKEEKILYWSHKKLLLITATGITSVTLYKGTIKMLWFVTLAEVSLHYNKMSLYYFHVMRFFKSTVIKILDVYKIWIGYKTESY
jgi:hypothetical protein